MCAGHVQVDGKLRSHVEATGAAGGDLPLPKVCADALARGCVPGRWVRARHWPHRPLSGPTCTRSASGAQGSVKSSKSVFHFHPEEVARQLTLLEFYLFSAIQPHEFLNQNWSRKDAATLSPHILAVSQRFNRTVQWVTASILAKRSVKSRARRMGQLIESASVRWGARPSAHCGPDSDAATDAVRVGEAECVCVGGARWVSACTS